MCSIVVITREGRCATGQDGRSSDGGVGSYGSLCAIVGGASDGRGHDQTRAILILIQVHNHVVAEVMENGLRVDIIGGVCQRDDRSHLFLKRGSPNKWK